MHHMKRNLILALVFLVAIYTNAQQPQGDPKLTEIWSPVPKIVTPGKSAADAPSDAIIIFKNKKDGDNWVNKDGGPFGWNADDSSFTVKASAGEIRTKQSFGDCQLHIEWRTPAQVKGDGQGRGNSGIFFMSRYELQVLDSYNNITYSNGQAGSIYKQTMPLVNASRGPGQWQVYDVIYMSPKFNSDGMIVRPAYITVLHNGVLIQNHTSIYGTTPYRGQPEYEVHGKGPIMLQDHDNTTSFRNIWIRPL